MKFLDILLQPQTSQKLIHGGRLLLDQQTLQEAVPDLLNADGVVIHLVAYERSASAPSGLSSSSSESYRQPVSRTPSRTPTSRQPSLTPVQENSRDDLAAQETTQRATVQQVVCICYVYCIIPRPGGFL